jgi:hypothetical protein
MTVHEAKYHGGQFVLCVDNNTDGRWPYPWDPQEFFVLEAQRSILSCDETLKTLTARGNSSVNWHTMGFWNQPYSYSVNMASPEKASFSYWRQLTQSFLKPSVNVISSVRTYLGLSNSSLRGVDCSRKKVFWQVFRDCVMSELYPEAATNWPRPWIAVHVRAGDALGEGIRPSVQAQTLESTIALLPRYYSQGTVFLATDSQEIVSQFGGRDGWNVVSMKVDRKKYDPDGHQIHDRKELNVGEIMIDLLLDMGLLSQADILVLPQYGSFSRLIALMAKHGSTVISSDGAYFCPYAMCEVGRTDDCYIEKGGWISGVVKDTVPNVTISQCYDDNFMLQAFNIPPEVVNFYRVPCLKRANLSQEEYLRIAPMLLHNVTNIFADKRVETVEIHNRPLGNSIGGIQMEYRVFQTGAFLMCICILFICCQYLSCRKLRL